MPPLPSLRLRDTISNTWMSQKMPRVSVWNKGCRKSGSRSRDEGCAASVSQRGIKDRRFLSKDEQPVPSGVQRSQAEDAY